MVEALLNVWKIDNQGHLYKEEEKYFKIEQYEFQRSETVKMKMQLSNDKRYAILPIIDISDKTNEQSAQLLAWSA